MDAFYFMSMRSPLPHPIALVKQNVLKPHTHTPNINKGRKWLLFENRHECTEDSLTLIQGQVLRPAYQTDSRDFGHCEGEFVKALGWVEE